MLSALLLVASSIMPGRHAHAADQQSFHGILEIVWGDPAPETGEGGGAFYRLVMADGTRLALQLDGKENLADNYFGQQVVVSGRPVESRSAGGQAARSVVVDSIASGGRSAAASPASAGAPTTKKVIFLLLKFSDDVAVPHPASFYTDMTNPDTPPPGAIFPTTVNGFFKRTSAGQFSWSADVGGVGGVPASDWLTLPFPKSHYVPCGWSGTCSDLQSIGDDGVAAGIAQGIHFTDYDNINFVLSNDLDCCAWGGGFYDGNKVYGATWEPPWGHDVTTYAHEMGHSIGLPHSGWRYYAYDSPWDVMSGRSQASSVACGSYLSDNSGGSARTVFCTEPGDGYIAPHKEHLGWIPEANLARTHTSATSVVSLEGASLPVGTGVKMIKLCIPCEPCEGYYAHYFTVEARVRGLATDSQYDNQIPGDGVIIHEVRMDRPAISGKCFWNSQSGWAVPVDATPDDWDGAPVCSSGNRVWPNYALYNAQWLPGQTFTDPQTGATVQIQSRSGSSFVVAINAQGAPAPTASCDDDNPCTDDSCDIEAGCLHADNSAPCDDGFFCTLNDTCSEGSCVGSGDPCAGGPECNDSCNEAADSCATAAGVSCSSDSNPCTIDQCDGDGACEHVPGNAGTICRGSAGDCDVAEACTGSDAACPGDTLATSDTLCRAAAGVCDVEENCSGSAADCPADLFVDASNVCRESAGICDPEERCSGASAACPGDVLSGSTTVCRAAAGACDVQESCDGSGAACPADIFLASSSVCRAADGICDVAELCMGSSEVCPADAVAASTSPCRPGAGPCDLAESCDGAAKTCPADAFVSGNAACVADNSPCTNDVCDGSSPACQHVANSAACSDGVFCNGADTCAGGACTVHAGNPCAGPDGDSNCSESCNEAAGACTAADPNASPCDDGQACTVGDSCSGGVCSGDLSPAAECSTTTTTLPLVLCGDANADSRITATDAQKALRTAVGAASCELARCDYNGDGKITAPDAQAILKRSVGQPVTPKCPSALLGDIPATVPVTTTTLVSGEGPEATSPAR